MSTKLLLNQIDLIVEIMQMRSTKNSSGVRR